MATGTVSPSAPETTGGRRGLRRLSSLLIVVGVSVLLYAGVILAWGDPATWVWTQWQQRELAGQLNGLESDFKRRYAQRATPATTEAALAQVRSDARSFAARTAGGEPVGRLEIGRIGLSVVVVQGTDRYGSLDKGPGHYENTTFPGLDSTAGVAGHRTTFGAPFRHIDEIRDGDFITLEMPYATFTYRVEQHRIVDDKDWSIIEPQGYERLVLSACHPLYSAEQRWIVFAKAVSVKTPDGRTLAV